ncbi:MAG: thiamine-monophosphate kinase [Planctomycetes bacterium]|nr:thiamine-monophosphate kinase [Planctomycetota bacterium]
MTWSEDSIHRWLAKQPKPSCLAGSQGHDAAVLKPIDGRPVLCVDACVEGVHFEVGASAKAVGRKAAGRALSDLAATGAEAEALLLALRAPVEARERQLRGFIQGVQEMALESGASLVGGDTTCAPGPLSLTVSALGRYRRKGKPPGRDRAREGQIVVVTGPLGGSLLGRHLKIQPRLKEAGWLLDLGATALMDISDGLLLDLERMANASRVCMQIDQIPMHRDAKRRARITGYAPLRHALTDGEDYELIACVPRASLQRLQREAAKFCPGLSIVGRVKAGRGVDLNLAQAPEDGGQPVDFSWLEEKGWLHGTR